MFKMQGVDVEKTIPFILGRGNFLEVGVFLGDRTVKLAKHFDKVYAVDNFCCDGIDCDKDSIKTETLKRLSNIDNVELIVENSVKASERFEDGFFDCALIDGGHRYVEVKNDIKAWMPKIKNSGQMVFHDVDRIPVKMAIISYFGKDGIKYLTPYGS